MILVANPGSASRKYALFDGEVCVARYHFEYDGRHVIYRQDNGTAVKTDLTDIAATPRTLAGLLKQPVDAIGLRVVAPSRFFQKDHLLTKPVIAKLDYLLPRAPLHIVASLHELRHLRQHFGEVPIYGISDSAFHATKPDYAQHYGLPIKDAERLEIRRFGYHGLAVASAVHQLRKANKLTPKLVVVHLGSGASVTAVKNGRSLDNTMGYSPLEGLIMATRSGAVDSTAVRVLQSELELSDRQLDVYLNQSSGLLGLGGSSDMRELLRQEADGDNEARLALNTYVFTVQKAVGAMAAVLGGLDQLVFTGTVGERSAVIRHQIIHHLAYMDLFLDGEANKHCLKPTKLTRVSHLGHSKPIQVVPIDEAAEIVKQVLKLQ